MTDIMKKIVIVGATSGIGLALVEAFAARGWLVGAAGRRIDPLRAVEAELPGKVITRRIDINAEQAVKDLEALIDQMGGMDVYFHVAGVGIDNPGMDPELDCRTAQTNVVGFTRMIDAAYRWFFNHNQRRGRIAAITSVAGTQGVGTMAAYSASKAYQQYYLRAIEQLARVERARIRTTDIRPGWIRTALLAEGGKFPMLMTREYAVRRIVRAVERGRRVAVVDWRWGILVGLWRLIPRWLWVRLPVRISGLSSPSL